MLEKHFFSCYLMGCLYIRIFYMANYKRYCYIVPFTEGFHKTSTPNFFARLLHYDSPFTKDRPNFCWESAFGWLDGYGILFDPVLQAAMESVPEFCNGAPSKTESGLFYITSGRTATEEFHPAGAAGVFLCPDRGRPERFSQKERLKTPCGDFFMPLDFPYTDAEGNDPAWKLGERSVLFREKEHVELYFELFFMVAFRGHEFPHQRLLTGADLLARIIDLPGNTAGYSNDFRLDCQSYGIHRLLMQWLLNLLQQDARELQSADTFYLEAIRSYDVKAPGRAGELLKESFCELCRIRKKYIRTDLRIAEFSHAGILFPESGFFELEWPEGSRANITTHLDDVEHLDAQVNFELSASDWAQLKDRFPETLSRIRKLWDAGKIELTNGTFSLPYAFVSPLGMQYFQFKYGQETFRSVFGREPELYQCQENSFTPQMPELLTRFGYKYALHAAQNHGSPVCKGEPCINWTTPAGFSIPALTCALQEQYRLGVNFFLALPLLLFHHREREFFNVFNMMDLGFIPLRESIVRGCRFAPVFARFVSGGSQLREKSASQLPACTFTPDDYNFSADAFYRNYTNKNAISQFEHLFELSAEFRCLQMLGMTDPVLQQEICRKLCLLEAHDIRVQGQRPGEFYYRRTQEPSPASRKELSVSLANIRADLRQKFDSFFAETVPEKTTRLFNPAEVPLSFAELRHPEKYAGSAVDFCGRKYVAGDLAPLTVTAPGEDVAGPCRVSEESGILGQWSISVRNDRVIVSKGSKSAVFSPADHLQGEFRCLSSVYQTCGDWLTAQLIFVRTAPEAEIVTLEGITAAEADYV